MRRPQNLLPDHNLAVATEPVTRVIVMSQKICRTWVTYCGTLPHSRKLRWGKKMTWFKARLYGIARHHFYIFKKKQAPTKKNIMEKKLNSILQRSTTSPVCPKNQELPVKGLEKCCLTKHAQWTLAVQNQHPFPAFLAMGNQHPLRNIPKSFRVQNVALW